MSTFCSTMLCFSKLSVVRQKGKSQNGGNKNTKPGKFFEKTNISYPLIRTRTYTYGHVHLIAELLFAVFDSFKQNVSLIEETSYGYLCFQAYWLSYISSDGARKFYIWVKKEMYNTINSYYKYTCILNLLFYKINILITVINTGKSI